MLYIRTDMNEKIATGHVMRCLSIADAVMERGEDTTFILADGQACSLLEKRGYPYIVLHTKWDDMESELPKLEMLAEERNISRILIDSYQVTENYLKRVTAVTKTVYLDDLGKFTYPVDAVVCYAAYWEKFHYGDRYKGTAAKRFLGPEYTPLGKAFSNCKKKEIKPQAENLLLLSGGTDHYDILEKMLKKIDIKSYGRIDVICGIYYPKFGSLCERYGAYNNVHIHKAVGDIWKYMEKADLAVTAGGTALYELCAFGTPAVSYIVADNQEENVKKFQEDGLIDYAGDVRRDDVAGNVWEYLKLYHADESLRREKSLRMQALVDGKGAGRIADILAEI